MSARWVLRVGRKFLSMVYVYACNYVTKCSKTPLPIYFPPKNLVVEESVVIDYKNFKDKLGTGISNSIWFGLENVGQN